MVILTVIIILSLILIVIVFNNNVSLLHLLVLVFEQSQWTIPMVKLNQ